VGPNLSVAPIQIYRWLTVRAMLGVNRGVPLKRPVGALQMAQQLDQRLWLCVYECGGVSGNKIEVWASCDMKSES
jgi:hypothetical protein